MACLWPSALIVLGWRLGRHRSSATAPGLVFRWVFPIVIEFAFPPVLRARTSLQAMTALQTPELTAAAV